MLLLTMSATLPGIQKRFFRPLKTYSRTLKYFRVLGIETSCDDTGVAVVDSNSNILGEAKRSQTNIHALHGGIMPHIAESLHRNHIKEVAGEALEKSKLTVKELDAIAVTVKPGIFNNLTVGLEYAKDLCALFNKPLIPIHHMEAHALTIRLMENVEFPFLVLLISGAHCILALAESIVKFRVLGETADIAPGLLLDKAARRLKLPNMKGFTTLAGGVAIEKAAEEGNPLAINLYLRTPHKRSCNFVFSGWMSTLNKYINSEEQRLGIEGDELLPNVHDISASYQYGITKYISERVEIGINYLEANQIFEGKNKNLVVSGGVASNNFIRKMLTHVCDAYGFKLLVPPKSLCTDNGVMVAWNGIEKLRENLASVPPTELNSVTCTSRVALGEFDPNVGTNIWRGSYVQLKNFIETKTHEQESTQSIS